MFKLIDTPMGFIAKIIFQIEFFVAGCCVQEKELIILLISQSGTCLFFEWFKLIFDSFQGWDMVNRIIQHSAFLNPREKI